MTLALRTNVGMQLRAVAKERRASRRKLSRLIRLGVIAGLALAIIGSVGHAEARVPADNPRTDGTAWYCGELQDRYDYNSDLYQQRKAANPNDPSLSGLKSEMQTLVSKWEPSCRSTFGSITFFNPGLVDIANVGNLSVMEANPGNGNGGVSPTHGIAKVDGVFTAR